jgi:hypothetical protein
MFGISREVERERAVIAETVQRHAPGQVANQPPVLALIQEGARLLAVPRSGERADTVFHCFDVSGYVPMEQFNRARQPLALSHGGIVARQDAGWIEDVGERGDYLRSKVFQPRAQKLNDETVRVSIHNEGRKGIALPVYDAICVGNFW